LALVGLATGCPAKPAAPATTFAAGKTRARLLFVGDTSVARDVGRRIDVVGGGDPRWLFAAMKQPFDDADLVFANLECVVSASTDEEATAKTWRIRAEPKHAAALKESGIDVVSVANNHAMDFGQQGFESTLAAMAEQGVVTVGIQQDGKNAQTPVVLTVGNTRVAFLAYNQHGDEYKHPVWPRMSSNYSAAQVVADVKAARKVADVVVVSVHGGPELSHLPDAWQRNDARKAVDAGADLWIGHHPHVAQPVERYRGKLIVYSLGDFAFDKTSPWIRERTSPRLFLSVDVENGAIIGDALTGGKHDQDYQPSLDPSFPVDAWFLGEQPPALSQKLLEATVERVRDGKTAPCTVNKKRLPGPPFRWLVPRLTCPDESRRPWQAVARSAELAGKRYREGVWAVPHAGGALRVTFPQVVLGASLQGFAGIPDWGLTLGAQRADKQPVTLRVTVPGTGLELVHTAPWTTGWQPLALDTAAHAGATHDVVVELSGGAGDAEHRFLFDLWPVSGGTGAAGDAPGGKADGTTGGAAGLSRSP